MEWIPITGEGFITESAIVTQLINNRSQSHVTIGLPGWGYYNDTIAYMPLPRPINEDKRGWKSEYWGDELPSSGKYIVQLQKNSDGRLRIGEGYYSEKDFRWSWISADFDVVAWRKFPKPYRPQTLT